MDIEEFIEEKQIEILAYHGPKSSLVDAFVIQASDLRKFMKGRVLLDIEDVRKLLGGFGASGSEMMRNKAFYEDHPNAAKRIAAIVKEAMKP